MGAFLTAEDLAERSERNEPKHYGAEGTFTKATGVPERVKTLNFLSDKEMDGQEYLTNEDPAWGN